MLKMPKMVDEKYKICGKKLKIFVIKNTIKIFLLRNTENLY